MVKMSFVQDIEGSISKGVSGESPIDRSVLVGLCIYYWKHAKEEVVLDFLLVFLIFNLGVIYYPIDFGTALLLSSMACFIGVLFPKHRRETVLGIGIVKFNFYRLLGLTGIVFGGLAASREPLVIIITAGIAVSLYLLISTYVLNTSKTSSRTSDLQEFFKEKIATMEIVNKRVNQSLERCSDEALQETAKTLIARMRRDRNLVANIYFCGIILIFSLVWIEVADVGSLINLTILNLITLFFPVLARWKNFEINFSAIPVVYLSEICLQILLFIKQGFEISELKVILFFETLFLFAISVISFRSDLYNFQLSSSFGCEDLERSLGLDQGVFNSSKMKSWYSS
ncbi:MAG: hypothetical protein D6732_04340 [Methanobacteriota archaeon]|nr:MAG: hypothetical protein D6732_04340 [Euryarchaeota archaeon]